MKPGATTRPSASMTRFAVPGGTILPPATPMSPRLAGAPVPSTSVALRIRTSSAIASGAGRLPLGRALRLERALVLLYRRLQRGLVLAQQHAHLPHLLAGSHLEFRQLDLRLG